MVCVLFSGISESGPSQSPIIPSDLMQKGSSDYMTLLCSHKDSSNLGPVWPVCYLISLPMCQCTSKHSKAEHFSVCVLPVCTAVTCMIIVFIFKLLTLCDIHNALPDLKTCMGSKVKRFPQPGHGPGLVYMLSKCSIVV